MDYDDSPKSFGPVGAPKSQVGQVPDQAPPATTFTPRAQRQLQAGEALISHTLRPVALQRQQLAGVLSALTLDRHVGEGLADERAAVQRQLDEGRASVSGRQMRVPATQLSSSGASFPGAAASPVGTADWVGVARAEVERVEDPAQPGRTRWLSAADRERHVGTLRAVGQGLARDFRADRGPAAQRYAEYGEQLATLQRQSLTRGVPISVLAQLPPAERPLLQRALDEALQRQAEQEQQGRAAQVLHGLQHRLDDLGAQAERPVSERIEARRGGGQPLPAEVRRALEAGLNHDLSGVRVHTDAEAHLLARKMNAEAFTTGRDIYFQAGRFDPNSRSGTELLAHEVAHVRQQARGRVGRGVDPDAGLEAEARGFGQRFVATRERKTGPRRRVCPGRRQTPPPPRAGKRPGQRSRAGPPGSPWPPGVGRASPRPGRPSLTHRPT